MPLGTSATVHHPSRPAGWRIIVFGRYPLPGETKTRLIPVLGPVGAAELQRRMTLKTLATAVKAAQRCGATVAFCCSGAPLEKIHRWLRDFPVSLSVQSPGDLGRRMHAALEKAFGEGCARVVLVGTDIPRLSVGHLEAAFEDLTRQPVVLGPSRDGGYWLVGMRRALDIFQQIPWSTPAVLASTVAQVRRRGLGLSLLEPLQDLDTPQDLKDLDPQGAWRRPYLSVIIPTFNEADRIAAACTVRQADCEVIVVDGGSRDATVERARRSGARVIRSQRGRALQQNRGARAARGAALLFLHADTRLPGDYASRVFETLLDRQVALGAFRFQTDLRCGAMRLIEWATRIRSDWFKLPYGDQALFLRADVFHKIGGFPAVPIAEDLFMVRRARQRGRIVIVPRPAVTSARRWRRVGLLRTTLINYLITAGCLAGVAPRRLVPLYGARTAEGDDPIDGGRSVNETARQTSV